MALKMNALLATALSLWILPSAQYSQPWESGLASLAVPSEMAVFIGEQHYTPVVQAAEAQLIRTLRPQIVGWEFLNANEQAAVDHQIHRLRSGEIPLSDFFQGIPSLAKDPQIAAYLPVVAAVAETDARLIALNAPRAIKRQLRKEGWDTLPSEWQPPRFPRPLTYAGSYWERFVATMTGHDGNAPAMPESDIQSFYLAQFYTDDVMAWKAALALENQGPSIWIAGSFHMDYGLGFTARFHQYSNAPSFTIKLVDGTALDAEGRAELNARDPRDGWIADAVGVMVSN